MFVCGRDVSVWMYHLHNLILVSGFINIRAGVIMSELRDIDTTARTEV